MGNVVFGIPKGYIVRYPLRSMVVIFVALVDV